MVILTAFSSAAPTAASIYACIDSKTGDKTLYDVACPDQPTGDKVTVQAANMDSGYSKAIPMETGPIPNRESSGQFTNTSESSIFQLAASSPCEVVSFSGYAGQVLVSGGTVAGGVVSGGMVQTEQCASFTVRNNSGTGRVSMTLTAELGGVSDTKSLQINRLQSGETYSGQACFTFGEPITALTCSF